LPELRKDPITGRWVIIATERAKRPTDFVREKVQIRGSGFCPFCYGNESKTPPEIIAYRSDGSLRNAPGWSLRVVSNKFPALGIEGSLNRQGEGLYDKMSGIGAHEVIIETPDHQKTLAMLSPRQIEDVLWAYRDRILDLKKDRRFKYIMIFKNHGEAAGASLEHTHSQFDSFAGCSKEMCWEETGGARDYFNFKERCIFCDIIRQETESGIRVIADTAAFIAVVPFAPRFPFEIWIMPRVHQSAFEDSQKQEFEQLAVMLKDMLMRLDKVLDYPAYNYIIHTSPIPETPNEHYHWHLEIMPKLTKIAGFEWVRASTLIPLRRKSPQILREAQVELTS